jgi:uncharacterized protein (DUF2235 family)
MPKRLVVACDGTWNRPDQLSAGVASPTNVAKLALAVAREDAGGDPQLLYYHSGVGTRRFERVSGGAFGFGLSRNVRDCYRFLVESYEPGDELYLFGFSRGAFTARSTAGLVRNCGILRAEHADRIGEAYNLYRARSEPTKPTGIAAQMFRRMYSHPDARIRFIGVWDTVGALGIPTGGLRLPWLTRRWGFHDTKLSSRVRFAYHALSIDEKRGPFRPTLWQRQEHAVDQTLEQVWFAGVHCDVGGGYRDPALSEISLLWMVERARACGLAFDPDRFTVSAGSVDGELRHTGVQVAPDALGEIHESRKGFYLLLGSYVRALVADGGSLASSAERRHSECTDYDPPGLSSYLRDHRPVTDVQDGGSGGARRGGC